MNSQPNVKSERGIALVVVLLLMAVLSGLATGYAMNGNVEVQMGNNEVYFAGARAAAEAGLNRAIVEIVDPANNLINLIAGPDGVVDDGNPAAAVNADNGSILALMGSVGPFALGTTGQYSYTIEILDDDNPALYESLAGDWATQVGTMAENNLIYTNNNKRLILRATGFGPNGTVVRISRIIDTDPIETLGSTDTTLSDAAILVNGDFEMNGNITVTGLTALNNKYASVHANGNLSKTGDSGTVTGNATASGTANLGGFTPGGESGGGRPTVTVPEIQASNYENLANYKLAVVAGVGQVQTKVGGVWTECTSGSCKTTGWEYSGGVWNLGKSPGTGTYYVEGDVDIGPTSGSSNNAVSVISTGSINVHGNAKLTPANTAKVQFVANGDIEIVNGADLDDLTVADGQILVRGQFEAGGNMEFQGRVLVQDVQGVGNLVDNGGNRIHGSVKFTYTGSLEDISTTIEIPGSTTYTNNVSGWMEQ
jgi:hypothetical protein